MRTGQRQTLTADSTSSNTARIEAIKRGLADVLASNIVPRRDVAIAAGVAKSASEGQPAQRAVVWASTAREVYLGTIDRLAEIDSRFAVVTASMIDREAEGLGHDATGTPGRVETTFEKAVANTAFVLVYEIVGWTKAGEVIAILHLMDDGT